MTRRQLPLLFVPAIARPQIWRPDEIRWQREDSDGTRYAILHGDRANANGLFVYAFWMPAGAWVKAHTHTRDAHVAVAKGSLQLGFGAKMDKAKSETIRAGDFFSFLAGSRILRAARKTASSSAQPKAAGQPRNWNSRKP